MKRRDFIKILLASGIAPAVVRAESLMRVKELPSGLVVPDDQISIEDIRKAIYGLNRVSVLPSTPSNCYWGVAGKNAGESVAKLIEDVYLT